MENIMNELEKLLKDLYKISGLNMSIFDLNQNLLASYPHKKSKFCNELEKNNIVLIVIIKLWNMSKKRVNFIFINATLV